MKIRNKVIILIIVVVSFASIYLGILGYRLNAIKKNELNINLANKGDKELKYRQCLINSNIDMSKEQEELNDFLDQYKASIKYYDLTSKNEFLYNTNQNYYGASLIKVIDILYVYNQALLNPTYLNKTIKYTKEYQYDSSLGLEQHKFNEELTLETLTRYAISYSDNGAHIMLVDYLGKNNLIKFMKDLNLKYTYNNNAYFGTIDVNDAFSYIYNVYKFMNNNLNYKENFMEAFDNTYYNNLKVNDLIVLHKYGYYGSTLHDIGIIYDEKPYILVVLTREANNSSNIINIISQKINSYHNDYYDKLENYCNK